MSSSVPQPPEPPSRPVPAVPAAAPGHAHVHLLPDPAAAPAPELSLDLGSYAQLQEAMVGAERDLADAVEQLAASDAVAASLERRLEEARARSRAQKIAVRRLERRCHDLHREVRTLNRVLVLPDVDGPAPAAGTVAIGSILGEETGPDPGR